MSRFNITVGPADAQQECDRFDDLVRVLDNQYFHISTPQLTLAYQWQLHLKDTALTLPADQLERAVMCLDDLFTEHQA